MIFGIGTDVVQLAPRRGGLCAARRTFRAATAAARGRSGLSQRTSGRCASWRCGSRPRKPSSRRSAPASRTASGSATSASHRTHGAGPKSSGRRAAGRCATELGAGEGHVTLTDEAGLVVAVAVLMRRAERAQHEHHQQRLRVRHRNGAGRRIRPPRCTGSTALTDKQVGYVMHTRQREQTGSEFLSLEQQRIVAISIAMRDAGRFQGLEPRANPTADEANWCAASSTASIG